MKHRSTFWQGALVAGIIVLSIPPSVYGQAAENGASGRKEGTATGCPSAEAGDSQPDLTDRGPCRRMYLICGARRTPTEAPPRLPRS